MRHQYLQASSLYLLSFVNARFYVVVFYAFFFSFAVPLFPVCTARVFVWLLCCCKPSEREAEPKVINHSWVALFGFGCVNPFHICTTLEIKKICWNVRQCYNRGSESGGGARYSLKVKLFCY